MTNAAQEAFSGKEKITFAIIGYGNIGRRYAELLAEMDGVHLTAVCDLRREVSTQLREDIAFFENFDGFLEAPRVADVVIISTPNGYHFPMANKLLDRGYHLVIEKPIAFWSKEVRILEEKSKAKGLHIFPVFQNRYSPPAKWLKSIVEDGKLGKIYMVQLNCFWNRDERYYTPNSWRGTLELDGGPLYTQFSHFIDILIWIFGSPSNIEAKFFDFNHQNLTEFEDSGIITFSLPDNAQGVMSYSTSVWNENLESSITVIGEKGSVKVGGQYMEKVETFNIDNYIHDEIDEALGSNNYGPYHGSAANHQQVLAAIGRVLQSSSTPDNSIDEALLVIKFIESAYCRRTMKCLRKII